MKRLWIAIALISTCLVLSVCELIYIDKNCAKYTEMIDEAEFYYSVGELNKASKICEDIYTDWKNKEPKLKAFLLHNNIDDITDDMQDLKEYAKKHDEDKFFSSCKKTKRQLLSIKESELPYIENIM